MSYRELRNFSEILRSLGYPRQVSIENFRTPNFPLVAEVLAWLLKRYEPDYEIPMEIDNEQERIIFIKTAAQFLVQKARIKVNPKKLYQADGYAVQEMLKVANLLYSAASATNKSAQNEDSDETFNIKSLTTSVQAKMNELRSSRNLATQITEKGASLFDLLNKEVDLREQRSLALARPLEISDVEKGLRSTIKAVEEEAKQTLHNLDNIASDETNLDAKIEKKRADLERNQKRLAQLQTVRPAYLEEYEKLENELKDLYSVYVQKFRNLAYLEHVYNEYDRLEQERTLDAEMNMRKIAEKMREEERSKLAMAEKMDVSAAMNDEFDQRKAAPKVYGSMTGAGASEEEEEENEENEEDDSLLTDDEDDEDLMGGGAAEKKSTRPRGKAESKAKSNRPSGAGEIGESDGDFDSTLKNNGEMVEPRGEAEHDSGDDF